LVKDAAADDDDDDDVSLKSVIKLPLRKKINIFR
jgi:hypothetical protein